MAPGLPSGVLWALGPQHCSLGSPTPGPGSWLRAAAWQPRAGGRRLVVWGFSLPEGPHCCVLSKRSGLMSVTCGTNLQGNSAAKPATFGQEAGSLSPPGGSGSPVWETRGLLMMRHKSSPAESMEPRGGVGEPTCPGQGNLIQGSRVMFHKLPSIQAIILGPNL